EILNISGNLISDLPKIHEQIPNLRTLNCECNLFTTISSSMTVSQFITEVHKLVTYNISQIFSEEHGVEGISPIASDPKISQALNLIFLVRPTTANLNRIVKAGIWASFQRRASGWNWIVLDKDLISMENESFYRQVIVDGDLSLLTVLTSALMQLVELNGQTKIGRILCKGELSTFISERLMDIFITKGNKADELSEIEENDELNFGWLSNDDLNEKDKIGDSTSLKGKLQQDKNQRQIPSSQVQQSKPSNSDKLKDKPIRNQKCFDSIILLDRSVDMITPLATQLTYLGLVDEFMGIQTSCINFESSKSEDDIVVKRLHSQFIVRRLGIYS
ncbi:MAG: hypothetical protein EZS28_013142, partial [Streblomastix strix]